MHFIQIETNNERVADDVKYSVLENKLARTVSIANGTRSYVVEGGIRDMKNFAVTFQTDKLEEIKTMMQEPTLTRYATMTAWALTT